MNLVLSNWFHPVSFNSLSKLLSLGHYDKDLSVFISFISTYLIPNRMGKEKKIKNYNLSPSKYLTLIY